jgi:hypothetical protein
LVRRRQRISRAFDHASSPANQACKRADLAEIFRLRDGKVCEIRPFYFDPGIVTEAVKAKSALRSGA